MKKITAYEIGWLAGIVDGEGSIGIRRGKKNGKYIFYVPHIQISNCDFTLLDKIKEMLDFYKIKYSFDIRHDARKINWSDSGRIALTNYDGASKFLELLYPYLVSKKENARILLEYCKKRIAINHRGQRNNGSFTKTYDGSENEVSEKLQSLNRKGKNNGKS